MATSPRPTAPTHCQSGSNNTLCMGSCICAGLTSPWSDGRMAVRGAGRDGTRPVGAQRRCLFASDPGKCSSNKDDTHSPRLQLTESKHDLQSTESKHDLQSTKSNMICSRPSQTCLQSTKSNMFAVDQVKHVCRRDRVKPPNYKRPLKSSHLEGSPNYKRPLKSSHLEGSHLQRKACILHVDVVVDVYVVAVADAC
jgi:hypothetical protein